MKKKPPVSQRPPVPPGSKNKRPKQTDNAVTKKPNKSRKNRSQSVNSRLDGGASNYEQLLKHREKRKAAQQKASQVLAIEYPKKE